MDEREYGQVVSIMKKNLIPYCENKSFSRLTTLGAGGTIKLVVYPDTIRKMVKAVNSLVKLKINHLVLGNGSNVLASDDVYDGVVVATAKMKQFTISGDTVTAQAGVSTVTLSKALQEKGLTGGEFFACLPATVGGAVVGNAGCFGQDVGSCITSVTVLHKGKVRVIPASKCGFVKRESIFKNKSDYVVLSAKFKFGRGKPDDIADKIANMRQRKASTQPLNYRSAGCALYHDKVAVSRLIDEAGLKGYAVGDAKISTKHAGFVVNVDKAQSKDIYLVIKHMQRALFERYGIVAKVEVCLVNFTKDERDDLFAGSKK